MLGVSCRIKFKAELAGSLSCKAYLQVVKIQMGHRGIYLCIPCMVLKRCLHGITTLLGAWGEHPLAMY